MTTNESTSSIDTGTGRRITVTRYHGPDPRTFLTIRDLDGPQDQEHGSARVTENQAKFIARALLGIEDHHDRDLYAARIMGRHRQECHDGHADHSCVACRAADLTYDDGGPVPADPYTAVRDPERARRLGRFDYYVPAWPVAPGREPVVDGKPVPGIAATGYTSATPIDPADCDTTTVYAGECRNFSDTEWVPFQSGYRRAPNAPDHQWLVDAGTLSIWVSDDKVRNLVPLVPATAAGPDPQVFREEIVRAAEQAMRNAAQIVRDTLGLPPRTGGPWTREDLPTTFEVDLGGCVTTVDMSEEARSGIIGYLNANYPKPAPAAGDANATYWTIRDGQFMSTTADDAERELVRVKRERDEAVEVAALLQMDHAAARRRADAIAADRERLYSAYQNVSRRARDTSRIVVGRWHR